VTSSLAVFKAEIWVKSRVW